MLLLPVVCRILPRYGAARLFVLADCQNTGEAPMAAKKTSGWIVFAGIMLMLLGAKDVIDGLWALRYDDRGIETILFEDNLTAWGWFYLILGGVLVAAGIAIFSRQQWARWTGIVLVSIGVFVNLFWAFIYPVSTLISVALGILVLYALLVYGEE